MSNIRDYGKQVLIRGIAILSGTAAVIGCLLVVGAWFSWMEISSEAYAYSETKFAELRQEHWAAFRLWGAVAVCSGLAATALALVIRKHARQKGKA